MIILLSFTIAVIYYQTIQYIILWYCTVYRGTILYYHMEFFKSTNPGHLFPMFDRKEECCKEYTCSYLLVYNRGNC